MFPERSSDLIGCLKIWICSIKSRIVLTWSYKHERFNKIKFLKGLIFTLIAVFIVFFMVCLDRCKCVITDSSWTSIVCATLLNNFKLAILFSLREISLIFVVYINLNAPSVLILLLERSNFWILLLNFIPFSPSSVIRLSSKSIIDKLGAFFIKN